MKQFNLLIFGLLLIMLCSSAAVTWGFFGHRRINRMAVFTLPPEMMTFYKSNIEYITEHAVDPDKRRYATKHEAVRHYIDIDHWGTPPFDNIPRNWTDCLVKFTEINVVDEVGDTSLFMGNNASYKLGDEIIIKNDVVKDIFREDSIRISYANYRDFYAKKIQSQYYEDEWIVDCDEFKNLFSQYNIDWSCNSIFAHEGFSEYGIQPFNLMAYAEKLTKAFQEKNSSKILQYSADFGHYIGDAHVPLHTTENYNGQLTNQNGIHGFWESRIPELFADKEYDYFVGPAQYIDDQEEYFWDIIFTSHQYVDSLLAIEKELSINFPQDKQYCYENRLEANIRTQCKEYAAEYRRRLGGQVEDRMRLAIHSIGSVWFTCWVNAGQPDLDNLTFELSEEDKKLLKKEEELFKKGEAKGRKHDQ